MASAERKRPGSRKGNWKGTEHEEKYTCVCERCGVVFPSSRELATSCSDGCRQALCRAKKKGEPVRAANRRAHGE